MICTGLTCQKFVMSGLTGCNTSIVKDAEAKTRHETLKRMRKINQELQQDPRAQLGLAGLQYKSKVGAKQATLINKGFKAISNSHRYSKRFDMDKQCSRLSFPCAKTNRKTIKRVIEEQNFECTLAELLQEAGVAVPDDMKFDPLGGFRCIKQRVEKCLRMALIDDYNSGIHMPDMLNRIENVNEEKQLRLKFQLLQADGFGHKNIKKILGLPDSTG